jgi:hypothetical protein
MADKKKAQFRHFLLHIEGLLMCVAALACVPRILPLTKAPFVFSAAIRVLEIIWGWFSHHTENTRKLYSGKVYNLHVSASFWLGSSCTTYTYSHNQDDISSLLHLHFFFLRFEKAAKEGDDCAIFNVGMANLEGKGEIQYLEGSTLAKMNPPPP